MFRINKDTTIGQILAADPEMENVFLGMGMHCSRCPAAQRETLEQAAQVHDLDVDDLIEDIKGFMYM